MPIIGYDGTRTFEGCVLATGEMNYHDDSDFYAVVWDAAGRDGQGSIHRVEYDTTRFAGGGSAGVDATEDVKRQAEKYLAVRYLDYLMGLVALDVVDMKVGREVVFLRDYQGRKIGRTVRAGEIGVVFWRGISHKAYSRWSEVWSTGVRLAADGARLFVADSSDAITVNEPEDYLPGIEELRERAEVWARGRQWRWIGSVASVPMRSREAGMIFV